MNNQAILNLPNFSMSKLYEMRQKRYLYCKASHCSRDEEEWFWRELGELSKIFYTHDAFQNMIDTFFFPDADEYEWTKMKGKNVVGEVYSQYIGEIEYKHTKHLYSWMCIKSKGLAIREHGHNEVRVVNGKEYVYRIKELYYFCNSGKLEVCEKGKMHCLINDTGETMYVVSCKIIPKLRIRQSNR